MARFKYLGEPVRAYVEEYGPCTQIKLPKKDGSIQTLVAPNQTTGFPINEDIGTEITDSRSLRHLRADPRFQEI